MNYLYSRTFQRQGLESGLEMPLRVQIHYENSAKENLKMRVFIAGTLYDLLTQDSTITLGFRYRQLSKKRRNKLWTTAANSHIGTGPQYRKRQMRKLWYKVRGAEERC